VALVLTGTVVTFDGDNVVDDGAVYVRDGRIAAVQARTAPRPPDFPASARVVDTGGVIYPGLIDLHSHIAYNTLPLWEAPGTPYLHHDRWPDEDDYGMKVTWPARVLQQAAAEALIKYVEVKALVGGTTAIQGAPRTTRPVKGWLVRLVDTERFGARKDVIGAATIQKRREQLPAEADRMKNGSVLIYHVGEGKAGAEIPVREFTDLADTGCLQSRLVAVHATALDSAHFERWRKQVAAGEPGQRGTVAWSPFSNLWLYDETTDVRAARRKKVRIALGSDWAPSGTKHVLGELKLADIVNEKRFGGNEFTDRELCELVTSNPGEALGRAWGDRIGRLRPGYEADLVVVAAHEQDEYRNLVDATEKHVQLVVIRGQPHYGTRALMSQAGVTGANAITVAGESRRVLVRMPKNQDARMTWRGVLDDLERVRKDPEKAWRQSADALAAWGGPLDSPEAPLAIFGDMPEGNLGVLGAAGEIPPGLEIPKPDSLEHDDDFFDAIDRTAAKLPGSAAELRELRRYYQ
jgi:cytosine/adenosine deaminase-related metal-dependent hydrolase